MQQIVSKFMKTSIVSTIILTVFAILLIIQSELTIMGVSYVVGALLIALGVQAELQYIKSFSAEKQDFSIVYGLACIILGILVIIYPQAIGDIIPFVIGFIIVINSAVKMQYSIEMKKLENKMWPLALILSSIMAICGIILIAHPFEEAVLITIGIFILVYAVLDLTTSLLIWGTVKKKKDDIKEAKIEEMPIVKEEESKNED